MSSLLLTLFKLINVDYCQWLAQEFHTDEWMVLDLLNGNTVILISL